LVLCGVSAGRRQTFVGLTIQCDGLAAAVDLAVPEMSAALTGCWRDRHFPPTARATSRQRLPSRPIDVSEPNLFDVVANGYEIGCRRVKCLVHEACAELMPTVSLLARSNRRFLWRCAALVADTDDSRSPRRSRGYAPRLDAARCSMRSAKRPNTSST